MDQRQQLELRGAAERWLVRRLRPDQRAVLPGVLGADRDARRRHQRQRPAPVRGLAVAAYGWYTFVTACHVCAKFLRYSDASGNDSRTSGQLPIFIANADYGFSEDENPDGPYLGPNVPSKSAAVPDGSTFTITVGPWDSTTA